MPKPVQEMEPSRPVSVPVNLVCFQPFTYTSNQSDVCSDQALLFPVLTGKVSSLSPGPRGTLHISISLIKAYKAGRLTITQVGETMSVKLVSQCKKCPLLRRGIYTHTYITDYHLHLLTNIILIFLVPFSFLLGANYIIMGQVDDEGRGTLAPGAFTAPYKAPHHRLLTNIQNQPC